jgi:DNA-binding winged helix-turn-helix (wHTH) protein/Tol biopolymer transport system component
VAVKSTFGPFELDASAGELRKFGTRIRLQGQPLEILSILVDRAGEVVSREELQQRLWSGNTFVDFENGLNTAVNKLRQALGESADLPRYVETIPGRGYRFIGPVVRLSAKPILEITPPGERTEKGAARRKPVWLMAGLVAAGLSAGYLIGTRQPSVRAGNQRPMRFTVTPPAGLVLNPASSRHSFALSPDGAHLAFSAMNSSGGYELFLRDLASLESRPVPNSTGAYHLFWAPDSRSILFTAGGKLRRTALAGDGGQQIIGDIQSIFFAGAFLDGERILLGGRRTSGLLPTSGGKREAVKEHYSWPQMLPDGRHILDIAFDSRGRYRARIARFGESAPIRELMETDSRVEYAPSMSKPGTGHLVYVRGGNLMAHPFDPSSLRTTGDPIPVASPVYSFMPTGAAEFSVSGNGMLAYQTFRSRSQLVWANRQGRTISALTPAGLSLRNGRLSPDGRSVATAVYDVERGLHRLWLFDTAAGTGRLIAEGEEMEESPTWAPDSRSLVFQRARVATPKLFLRAIGESGPDQPLPPHEFQVATDWSSDGSYVAFMSTGFGRAAYEDNGDVYVIDMKASPERKMFALLKTPFHEGNAVWSPDGRWLAFTSNESGQPEISVQRFQRGDTPALVGERYPVTRNGAQCIRWRRDGKELFYLAADGQIHAVPVTWNEGPSFGSPVPLFTISTAARAAIHSIPGFDISPDGQRFLVPVVTTPEDPAIVITQNWEPN